MLFKLINQFLSLKIKPPKNYDLSLPLHGIIIYVITSNMHDNFIIIIKIKGRVGREVATAVKKTVQRSSTVKTRTPEQLI